MHWEWAKKVMLPTDWPYFGPTTKGETITRVNGNVSFFAGKRLQNF